MGCAISRPEHQSSSLIPYPPDSALISVVQDLPFEIYMEVLGYLNTSTSRDRKALLALALSCRALRDESQRVLFNSLHRDANDIRKNSVSQARALSIHTQFLLALELSPDRLARYVVSYAQHSLGLDPALWSIEEALRLEHKNRRVHLWVVTERVLPLMVNLKHLYFGALVQHPSAPMILRNCTFKLESLTWDGTGGEKVLFGMFLPTQDGLLHLNINNTGLANRPSLPDGLCPSLTSIACPLSDLPRIATERHITALHLTDSAISSKVQPRLDLMTISERNAYLPVLKKLKYLRICTLPHFLQSTAGISFHSITTLEVREWSSEILSNVCLLELFPELRSLRLWENWAVLHSAFRKRAAAWAFSQCAKLEEVMLVVDRYVSTKVWRFVRPQGSEMYEERCEMDNNIALVWWRMQLFV